MKKTFEDLRSEGIINGLDEIINYKGTRTDIYNLIKKHNEVDVEYSNQFTNMRINNLECAIFLKKVDKGIYKIQMITITYRKDGVYVSEDWYY